MELRGSEPRSMLATKSRKEIGNQRDPVTKVLTRGLNCQLLLTIRVLPFHGFLADPFLGRNFLLRSGPNSFRRLNPASLPIVSPVRAKVLPTPRLSVG